ncbi:MAG: hypothetical protein Q9219_002394 [cf. Caloplaca sp. 3 TL-2023]
MESAIPTENAPPIDHQPLSSNTDQVEDRAASPHLPIPSKSSKIPKQVRKKAGQRLQALALIQHGLSQTETMRITKLSQPSISRLVNKARSRGWDPMKQQVLQLDFVLEEDRPGRPRKATMAENEIKAMARHEDRTVDDTSRPRDIFHTNDTIQHSQPGYTA